MRYQYRLVDLVVCVVPLAAVLVFPRLDGLIRRYIYHYHDYLQYSTVDYIDKTQCPAQESCLRDSALPFALEVPKSMDTSVATPIVSQYNKTSLVRMSGFSKEV